MRPAVGPAMLTETVFRPADQSTCRWGLPSLLSNCACQQARARAGARLALRGELLIQQAVAAAEDHFAGLLPRPRARRCRALPVRVAFCRRCMRSGPSAAPRWWFVVQYCSRKRSHLSCSRHCQPVPAAFSSQPACRMRIQAETGDTFGLSLRVLGIGAPAPLLGAGSPLAARRTRVSQDIQMQTHGLADLMPDNLPGRIGTRQRACKSGRAPGAGAGSRGPNAPNVTGTGSPPAAGLPSRRRPDPTNARNFGSSGSAAACARRRCPPSRLVACIPSATALHRRLRHLLSTACAHSCLSHNRKLPPHHMRLQPMRLQPVRKT